VRVIFRLPLFCKELSSQPLAYVELLTSFTPSPRTHQHGLFQTKHAMNHGKRITRVVPFSALRMACHLSPQYALLDPGLSITSNTDLLSSSYRFFLNRHSSYYFFSLMDYWKDPAHYSVSPLMYFHYCTFDAKFLFHSSPDERVLSWRVDRLSHRRSSSASPSPQFRSFKRSVNCLWPRRPCKFDRPSRAAPTIHSHPFTRY
jgi:hypothetical protein